MRELASCSREAPSSSQHGRRVPRSSPGPGQHPEGSGPPKHHGDSETNANCYGLVQRLRTDDPNFLKNHMGMPPELFGEILERVRPAVS